MTVQPQQDKPMARLLLGVTGSVSAAWMPAHVMVLRSCFAERVDVLLSRTASKFVSAYSLRQISGRPVYCEIDDHDDEVSVPHVELPRAASMFVIVPATASILGRCAHGLCDDLISTAVIATPRHVPVVFAPSMNEVMWDHPAVHRNVALLREQGHYVVEPRIGCEVATLEPVRGGMPPLHELCAELLRFAAEHRARCVPASAEPITHPSETPPIEATRQPNNTTTVG